MIVKLLRSLFCSYCTFCIRFFIASYTGKISEEGINLSFLLKVLHSLSFLVTVGFLALYYFPIPFHDALFESKKT